MNKLIIVVIAAMLCVGWYLTFGNPEFLTVKVNRVDKVEETSGSDGETSTNVRYLIYTDKGPFQVNIKGFASCPEAVGRLEKDSTYRLSVCGVECRFLGMYRNVTKVW